MTSPALRRLLWGILGVALLLVGAFALRSWMRENTRPPLMDLGALPPFALIDQTGTHIDNHSVAGRIWVADLIFTHCTTFCPQLTSKMKELESQLPADPTVRIVSVSVDPTHDSPDTLRQYAELHKIDTTRWSLWTGPVSTIYSVVKHGFHLPLDSVGGDQANYPIIHSPRFVLIDRRGHMRGYYNGLDDQDRKRILYDIETLRLEP